MSRRDSREAAFKVIFQYEFRKKPAEELVEDYFNDIEDFEEEIKKESGKLEKDYILEVVEGTLEHRDEFLALIDKTVTDWKLERVFKVEIAILTMAMYEMFYKDDIPVGVAINEAVDIAKKYGREESGKFVNGVLGTIYREKTGGEEVKS